MATNIGSIYYNCFCDCNGEYVMKQVNIVMLVAFMIIVLVIVMGDV